MRLALAAVALVVVSPASAIDGPMPGKERPAATKAAFIAAVQVFKTADVTHRAPNAVPRRKTRA